MINRNCRVTTTCATNLNVKGNGCRMRKCNLFRWTFADRCLQVFISFKQYWCYRYFSVELGIVFLVKIINEKINPNNGRPISLTFWLLADVLLVIEDSDIFFISLSFWDWRRRRGLFWHLKEKQILAQKYIYRRFPITRTFKGNQKSSNYREFEANNRK